MIINDLDGYYIVFDTKNWNTELDTLYNYFRNSNSINEAMTGISLDSSDSQRNYDLIERE